LVFSGFLFNFAAFINNIVKMKKALFILSLVVLSLNAYSQQGNLSVGAKGGYATKFQDVLYGVDLAYHLTDPFEIAFTGLMNPNVKLKDDLFNKEDKLSVYSANLDLRLYLLMQRSWATGPALGGQYLSINAKEDDYYSHNVVGFNIGWHFRANISDNMKVNAGWRYTNAKEETSYNYFYVGLAYTFELF
jgi:opacity protein-like surface antigen